MAHEPTQKSHRWQNLLLSGVLISVILLLAAMTTGAPISLLSQALLTASALVAVLVAAATLICRSSVPDQAELEERIEVLEDLRWKAQDDAHHLQAMLDGQADLIIQRDPAGKIIFVNRTFCRKFNLSLEAVVGRPFHPKIIGQAETSEKLPILPDLPAWAVPAIECVHTSDGARWIEWTHYSMPGEALDDCHVQTVGRDITRQRRNERDLATARDEARAADRAKSSFLASMSHEIRTPMNGIMGMTGLLSETAQSPEQKTYTEAVRKSAATLLALIDEILDFSKIEAGHLELAEARFDIIECVQGVVELLAPRAYEKNLELAWSLAPDIPRGFLGDETRLRQILLNLVGNAVKFTDVGGVSIWVGAEPAQDGHDHIKIVVRDTGPGLSHESRQRIFREFERAVPQNATHEGTGLGLAIARRLANCMGGDITVASEPGQGATFSLSMRLRRQDCETSGDSVGGVAEVLSARTVALVSGKAFERRTIANSLRSHNIAVIEAATVADLRHSIETTSPTDLDALLLDAEVCPNEARSLLNTLVDGINITAAVMGAADKRSKFECFHEVGIKRFLVRPIRPATLLALLAGDVERDELPAGGAIIDGGRATGRSISSVETEQLTWRVLVAEDNEINALLARTVLTRLGCEAMVVPNGREAIKAATTAADPGAPNFDVILMDLHMPEVDGLAATSEICRIYAEAGVPRPAIVAVTANAFEEDRQRCLGAGMDDYLSKPFEPKDLKRVLERIERLQASARQHKVRLPAS